MATAPTKATPAPPTRFPGAAALDVALADAVGLVAVALEPPGVAAATPVVAAAVEEAGIAEPLIPEELEQAGTLGGELTNVMSAQL